MVIVPIVVKAHAEVNRVILYSTLLYNYVFPWVKGGEREEFVGYIFYC